MSSIPQVPALEAGLLDDLPPPARALPAPALSQPHASFGQLMADGIEQVNRSLLASQADMRSLATGDVQNLHQVMIRIEESRLSFQLMLQVRNRLLESYQDVMRMQV